MITHTSKNTSQSGLTPTILVAFANEPINSENREELKCRLWSNAKKPRV